MTDVVRPLAGLLVAQVALAAFTWWPKPASSVVPTPLVDGGAEHLTAFTIRSNTGTEVQLTREGGAWVIPSASGYRADPAKVAEVTSALAAVTLGRPIAHNATSHEALGVTAEDARRTVSFTTDTGETRTVLLGAAGRDRAHLRIDGRDEVWAVDGLGVYALRERPDAYLPDVHVSFDPATLTAWSLSNASGTVAFVREGDAWTVEGDPTRVATDAAASLLDKAHEVRLAEVVGTQPEPAQGLAGDGAARVSWRVDDAATSEGGSYVVGAQEGSRRFVQVDDDPYVVLARGSGLSELVDADVTTLTQPRAAEVAAP